MKNLVDSLRHQIYERMSSPFFGSFIIAWLCWNHRYLVILGSSLPLEYRFTFARATLYPDWQHIVWVAFVAPLISSVAFILIYPYPSAWLFGYWHKRQVALKKKRDEIEGESLLTRNESRKIILDSLAIQSKYEEQIERQAREIEALRTAHGTTITPEASLDAARQRIAALEGELNRRDAESLPQNPLGRFKDETARGIEALLKILAELPGEDLMLESKALERLKLNSVQARHILDKALEAQVVFRQGDNNAVHLRLNERGREYVVNHNLLSATTHNPLAPHSTQSNTTMSRHQVSCINKRQHHNPHERIQNIGGKNADGTQWKLTEEAAIAAIENGTYSFFVNAHGVETDVIVATHLGRKYLKTKADGYEPNNLLGLQECP